MSRCNYCEEKYKDINDNTVSSKGGYINGYWFCKICIKFGLLDESDSESERIKMLCDVAKGRKRNKNLKI